MTESTDPYKVPGTDVLRNLRGIPDPKLLARFEAECATRRIAELINRPVQGRFDIGHLKAIHRHIFQDVYSWAGQFRTVRLSIGDQLFGVPAFIEPTLEELLRKLRGEDYLKGAGPQSFSARAGFYMAEINAIHPFREGNGRAQREFIRELGSNAGLVVHWTRLTQEQMIAASRDSFATGDSSGLAALILTCIR